jgi:anaerobic selenocysteine-containing dehydrogenase
MTWLKLILEIDLNRVDHPMSLTHAIVVDPRKTQIAQLAHLHVRHHLGTDVALLNGLMHVIYKNGWHNRAFIEERTENFADLLRIIEQFPLEQMTSQARQPLY